MTEKIRRVCTCAKVHILCTTQQRVNILIVISLVTPKEKEKKDKSQFISSIVKMTNHAESTKDDEYTDFFKDNSAIILEFVKNNNRIQIAVNDY